MTPRKRWPNEAESARIDSIAQARRGLILLKPMLSSEDDLETLRNLAGANDAFHRIINSLEAVGPQMNVFLSHARTYEK